MVVKLNLLHTIKWTCSHP